MLSADWYGSGRWEKARGDVPHEVELIIGE